MRTNKSISEPAERVEITEIGFEHEGNTLVGEIAVPTDTPVRAGLVLIQGSGPVGSTTSEYILRHRNAFTKHGIAVLYYDKPGLGDSTGDWRFQTLRDRADESLAALEILDEHAAPRALGLWGISQGGWVAPLAASVSDLPEFVISVSGPGVSIADQMTFSIVEELRRDSHPPEQIAKARETVESVFEAAREEKSFAEVERSIIEPRSDRPWMSYFEAELADGESFWEFIRLEDEVTQTLNIDFDPATVLPNVNCPILSIFGELDALVPVEESVAVFERALAERNDRSEVIVYPEADHGIYTADSSKFAAGYFERVIEWTRECRA